MRKYQIGFTQMLSGRLINPQHWLFLHLFQVSCEILGVITMPLFLTQMDVKKHEILTKRLKYQ